MFRRTRLLADPVTFFLDGEAISAERGEPLAVALLASDIVTLARSPKLHRPRGPSCLRGACDGCLARVDGEPNIMTCLRPTRGGERLETQNVVGSRKADLLRVTDWFFPKGFDHHHFMAGVPGISEVMQSFASKVAGLGKLPAEPQGAQPARRLDVDVAVIGAGPAGIAVASKLSAAGRDVCLIDDGIEPGGSLVGAPEVLERHLKEFELASVRLLLESVAAGIYNGEILVVREPSAAASEAGIFTGATILRARATVFAGGAHDGVIAFPNNDLPGVLSARAFCRLIARGVSVDGAVVLAGDGFWADELERRLGDRLAARVKPGDLLRVEGVSRAKTAVIREGSSERAIDVDAVAIAAPCAPSFEAAEQAGASIERRDSAGYAIVTDQLGRAGDVLWAVGECAGRPLDSSAFAEDAARAAAAIHAELAAAPA